jgi:hypothetical protein
MKRRKSKSRPKELTADYVIDAIIGTERDPYEIEVKVKYAAYILLAMIYDAEGKAGLTKIVKLVKTLAERGASV